MSSASFNLDHALCAAFPAAMNATAIETNSGLLYTAYDLERGHRQARGCLAADAIWASLKVNLANDKVPKWCMVVADLPRHAVAKLQNI